jgi:uncharacterized protein (DUF305 family)
MRRQLAALALTLVPLAAADDDQAGKQNFLQTCLEPSQSMPTMEEMDLCMASIPPGMADAAPEELEKVYLWRMLIHHQGAIDMAELAPARAQHQEIKSMAQNVTATQSAEMDQFANWLQQWHAFTPPDPHDTGMGKMMQMHAMELNPKVGSAFDLAFIEAMIPHHQAAIDNSQAVLQQLPHPEARAAAQKIIDDQRKEIQQLQSWRTQWATQATPPPGPPATPSGDDDGEETPAMPVLFLALALLVMVASRRP